MVEPAELGVGGLLGKRRQPVSRTLTCFPFILLLGTHSEEAVAGGEHSCSVLFTAVSLLTAQRGNNFSRRGCYFINHGVLIQWNIEHCFLLM